MSTEPFSTYITQLTSASSLGASDQLYVLQGGISKSITGQNLQASVAPFVSVAEFGAKGDGVTDDTAAIQAAIKAYQNTGATLLLPGGYIISSSLVIGNAGNAPGNLRLMGPGWGISKNSPPQGYLKWAGPAGQPMILVQDNFGGEISDLRFIGNSAAKPSYAIQYDTATGGTNTAVAIYNFIKRVWIGHFYGFDSDNANQFTNGIGFTGTINGDSNLAEMLVIIGCDNAGIYVQNPNADLHVTGLFSHFNGIGVRTAGTVTGNKIFMGNNGATSQWDIQIDSGGVSFDGYFSEAGPGLCNFTGGAFSRLILRNGGFQFTPSLINSNFINCASIGNGVVDIENFRFDSFGYTGSLPQIVMFNHSAGNSTGLLRLVNVGLALANLNLGTMLTGADSRRVIFIPQEFSGSDPMPMQQLSLDISKTSNQTAQWWRNDFPGKLNCFGGPSYVDQLLPPNNPFQAAVQATGTGATTYAYRVSALTYDGETVPCPEGTCTNAATLNGTTNFNVVGWNAVQGAQAYRVYGRTSGAELLMATLTMDNLHPGAGSTTVLAPTVGHSYGFKDDGSITPSGAMPTVNSTGNSYVAGTLTIGGTTVANLPPAASFPNARSFVTDATATTFASIVAGSGANQVPVYSDGTNWRIG